MAEKEYALLGFLAAYALGNEFDDEVNDEDGTVIAKAMYEVYGDIQNEEQNNQLIRDLKIVVRDSVARLKEGQDA
jgi:hypothetical protein